MLWLFIHWKFHVTDCQNRSFIFRVKRMHTSFLVSLLLPYPTSTHPISAHPTQRRYRIALPILLNICGTTLDPLTLICLPKSRLNQTSYSTGPPRLSYAEPHE